MVGCSFQHTRNTLQNIAAKQEAAAARNGPTTYFFLIVLKLQPNRNHPTYYLVLGEVLTTYCVQCALIKQPSRYKWAQQTTVVFFCPFNKRGSFLGCCREREHDREDGDGPREPQEQDRRVRERFQEDQGGAWNVCVHVCDKTARKQTPMMPKRETLRPAGDGGQFLTGRAG